MPKIEIKLGEIVTNIEDSTKDTRVLVPLYYVASSEFEGKSDLFTTKTEFEAAFPKDNITKVAGVRDLSYDVIRELLTRGLHVYVEAIEHSAAFNSELELLEDLKTKIARDSSQAEESIFKKYAARTLYDIKFITTGGHANIYKKDGAKNSDIAKTLISLAKERGDAIALVEFEETATFDDVVSTDTPSGTNKEDLAYSASFYPWGIIASNNLTSNNTLVLNDTTYKYVPASICYLLAYANSIKTNPEWLAVGGMQRGYVPDLKEIKVLLTEAQVDELQNSNSNVKHICVNAITRVNEVYRIWGNSTCYYYDVEKLNTNSYYVYLNIMNLVCSVAKAIHKASTSIMFDPNDNITYYNFINKMGDTLDSMKYGRGLEWYTWTKNIKAGVKGTISANLRLKPIEAVDAFEIGVTLTDSNMEG